MKKISIVCGLFLVLMFTNCRKQISPTEQNSFEASQMQGLPGMPDDSEEFVSNELIIKFKSGISATGIANAINKIGGTKKEHI